jgi:hypothetical protein
MEVELGQPAGQVDQHRRGGQQPEGRQPGADPPGKRRLRRQPGADRQRRRLGQAVGQADAAQQPEAEHPHRVQRQHPQDHPVAQLPGPLGQGAALRQQPPNAAKQVEQHALLSAAGGPT